MKWWYAVSLPGLMPILATLDARPASAAEGPCSPMAVEADASVRARWPDVTERLREAFDARDDIDGCARVRISMSDASYDMEVVLPDGRSASRSVSRAEDIVPTLEALLLVPQTTPPLAARLEPLGAPRSAAAAPGAQDAPVRAPPLAADRTAPARQSTKPTKPTKPTKSAAEPPRGIRVEFSIAAGARIGDGQASVGLGVLSFLDVAGWLVGFEGRMDSYQMIADGLPSQEALELAVLVGRRFAFGNLALDFTSGPAFVASPGNTEMTAVAGTRPSGALVSESRSDRGFVPRLLAGAHLNFGARSLLRTFVGIEGELGPAAADPSSTSGLPVWTVGLALGATVGTL